MVLNAFVLIQTRPGKIREAHDKLGDIPGCTAAYAVSGVFDVIALVEAEDLQA